jgi:murein L,D-transpeptidase YafK
MSAAVLGAVALAACDPEAVAPVTSVRSLQPLSPQLVADIEQKRMTKESPVLIRIFKEESELEVWKVDESGRFALLKTYPICRWSGELGPKVKEGDRQTPEGFYTITPGLMNPNSNYYLAINMGFPNAYDRVNGRNGDFLMIHGDCSSRGCYAMTDEQIAEIYALARESFFGGQRAFQIQAFPFRMTPLNMAKHRDSPHMAFWRMLKEGYDHFEVTRLEPKVDVCERHYVFDADGPSGRFTAGGKCPVYRVKEEIASAAKEKSQNDEREFAELVSRGTGTVPVRMGTDGGMHPVFLAAFERPHTDSAGVIRSPFVKLPGSIPSHTRPPGDPNAEPVTGSVMVASANSSGGLFGNAFAASGSKATSSSTASDDQSSGGLFASMSRLFGMGGAEPAPVAEPTAKPKTKAAKPTAVAAKPKATSVAQAPAKPPDAKSAPPPQQEVQTKSASNAPVLNGAQPVVPTGSFESRWGTFQ